MAQPDVSKFGDLLIYVEEVPGAGIFTKAPMAMNSRTWDRSGTSTKVTVPDQDNEDFPIEEQSIISTVTRSLSGKGYVGKENVAFFDGAVLQTRNYVVYWKGVGTWTGPMNLNKCTHTGERANVVTTDISMEQAGAMAFAAGGVPPGAAADYNARAA